MSLLDNFLPKDAESGLNSIKDALNSGLGAIQAATAKPGVQNTNAGDLGYYKIFIQANLPSKETINLIADGPSEFSFETSLTYDSPFADVGENAVDAALGGLGSKLGSAGNLLAKTAKAAVHSSGTRLITQALTAKVWTGASDTTIRLPLIFQVEDDEEDDVLTPIMQLMYLSMPREDTEGGLLSSPGPVFDWTSVLGDSLPSGSSVGKAGKDALGRLQDKFAGLSFSDAVKAVKDNAVDLLDSKLDLSSVVKTTVAGTGKAVASLSNFVKGFVKYPITLQIGQGLRLENVVIESVSQTHRLQPVGGAYNKSSGVNSRVLVEVTFKTFYTLTQRDIARMLMPMNLPGSKTNALYKKYMGN